MHISTAKSNMLINGVIVTVTIEYEFARGRLFDCSFHILKVKDKVVHGSIGNIFKMVTDRADITIQIKYEIAYRPFDWHI